MTTRLPLVLIPQHFGCLVFERRTSRYLPFDREATELLLTLKDRPLENILSQTPEEERQAILAFFHCFYQRGFFGLDCRLSADILDVDIPADHLVGPLAVHLEIVAACNLTCKHCFAGTLPRNHQPLTVSEMDVLFADLAGVGSFRLGLTGGEPLLRKDLLDILDSATSHGLHPCLTTNALLLTEETARELGKREMVWLNVSLEGPDAATNDAIRGPGTFDAVLDRLKLLRRHARFTLAFTILQTNAHLVEQCADLAYRVGDAHGGLPSTVPGRRGPGTSRPDADLRAIHDRSAPAGGNGQPRGGFAWPGPVQPRDPVRDSAANPHHSHVRSGTARLFHLGAGRRQPVQFPRPELQHGQYPPDALPGHLEIRPADAANASADGWLPGRLPGPLTDLRRLG